MLGRICLVASSPCQVVSSGAALRVDYVAPAVLPTPDPVTVQAVSVADVSKSGSSQVTIINHVLVTVLPGSALLVPLGVQPSGATVLGTDNQNVVWQIQGAGSSAAGICGIQRKRFSFKTYSTSDPEWPALQGCVAPAADISFTVRTQPGP